MKIIIKYIILVLCFGCFTDYTKYDKFKSPIISNYDEQIMLVNKVKGDPSKTAGDAISTLYKAFYKIKSRFKIESNPPHAKWITPYEFPKNSWTGKYAIPLNKSVTKLPEDFKSDFPNLTLEIWNEGNYAELLHIGGYESINISTKILEDYISNAGFIINGYHEEIYIKGPGMIFNGNPDKYLTLIRYPVKELN